MKYKLSEGERDALYDSCGCIDRTGNICDKCQNTVEDEGKA